MGNGPWEEALIASFLAGISTGIGAIPVLIFKKISHSHGNKVQATFAAIAGFITMIALNVVFGA